MESGIVKEITGDNAIVRLERNDSCKKCSARIICRPDSEGFREARALNLINADVGDQVEISESGNFLLILSIMQFGVPLLGLISGIFLLNAVDLSVFSLPKELIMSIGGLVGLLAGGFITWIWAKYIAGKKTSVFRIVNKTSQAVSRLQEMV